MHALDNDKPEEISGLMFQQLVALITIAIYRGDDRIADLVRSLSPILGKKHAPHLVWFFEILSGPACEINLWDWQPVKGPTFLSGAVLYLNPPMGSEIFK